MPSFSYADVVLMVITLAIRSIIISVRYGMMSKIRYGLMKTKLSIIYITSDFIVYAWANITPKTLEEEIRAVKYRNEISDDDFIFSFVEELPQRLRNRLTHEDYYDKNSFNLTKFKKLVNQQKRFVLKSRRLKGNTIDENEFEDLHKLEEELDSQKSFDELKNDLENPIERSEPSSGKFYLLTDPNFKHI